ncbi:MAG: hypothetical protein DRP68_02825 [Candidatus Omnitrophota bacterium]|nr:MAG: hypothetical protein DRP68_02825 [Candidatus Omnitrophota bacterium]HDN86267.1 hypothetical protein [Candidatus Omnitrophota bacterium]
MKVAIVFYSFSGNTEKAVLFLKNFFLRKNIPVEVFRLKPVKEETSFFRQGMQAFLKEAPPILEINYDLDSYDLVVFASPVWAFTISPALRSYLRKVKNLARKKIVCFLTFGSGVGAKKALRELESILKSKKAEIIFSKSLAGSKVENKSYLEESFRDLTKLF